MTTYTEGAMPGGMPVLGPAPLRVEARNADALFDDGTEPTCPHTGRMMNAKLAIYLERLAREQRGSSSINIQVGLNPPTLGPSEEDQVRRQLHTYFAEEQQLAELDLRLNQKEGWAFLRTGRALIIFVVAIAGLLYLAQPDLSSVSLGVFLAALLYLLFIAVVWVMLWDPIEKLIFDAYLLRARVAALGKLRDASIQFTYGMPSPTAVQG